MQELSANRSTTKKYLSGAFYNSYKQKKEFLQSLNFFHMHKLKLKTGQEFTLFISLQSQLLFLFPFFLFMLSNIVFTGLENYEA